MSTGSSETSNELLDSLNAEGGLLDECCATVTPPYSSSSALASNPVNCSLTYGPVDTCDKLAGSQVQSIDYPLSFQLTPPMATYHDGSLTTAKVRPMFPTPSGAKDTGYFPWGTYDQARQPLPHTNSAQVPGKEHPPHISNSFELTLYEGDSEPMANDLQTVTAHGQPQMPPNANSEAVVTAASVALANFHHRGSLQLWQFLVALLDDSGSQHLICWTGRRLEFKLNEPEEVARLWGIQKNRPAMNYDKLSRSLRYYYEKGIMQKVSGERYVYRFVYEPELLFALAFPGEDQPSVSQRPRDHDCPIPSASTVEDKGRLIDGWSTSPPRPLVIGSGHQTLSPGKTYENGAVTTCTGFPDYRENSCLGSRSTFDIVNYFFEANDTANIQEAPIRPSYPHSSCHTLFPNTCDTLPRDLVSQTDWCTPDSESTNQNAVYASSTNAVCASTALPVDKAHYQPTTCSSSSDDLWLLNHSQLVPGMEGNVQYCPSEESSHQMTSLTELQQLDCADPNLHKLSDPMMSPQSQRDNSLPIAQQQQQQQHHQQLQEQNEDRGSFPLHSFEHLEVGGQVDCTACYLNPTNCSNQHAYWSGHYGPYDYCDSHYGYCTFDA